jgi:hypothetical protein
MTTRRADMITMQTNLKLTKFLGAASAVVFTCFLALGLQAAEQAAAQPATPSVAKPKVFATAQQAADALIAAAEKNDTAALEEIFGPEGHDILFTGEPVRDKEAAASFAEQARKKKAVVKDPASTDRAFLVLTVGEEDWPFPVPIVKTQGKWAFDAAAGREELFLRRIGENELDAIEFCRGYVEAQHEYALFRRDGYSVNQYAQRIISTPGKQDGLAWINPDGTWDGPVGDVIARVIEQGYSPKAEPYHGYFFKVLKGQGPAAPLGEMDFVVNGVMIGGFALMASPAKHGITGVKSFIVSHDGVVYEKDLGPDSLSFFQTVERFNPDETWDPIPEPDDKERLE